jgi:hypothetical protein
MRLVFVALTLVSVLALGAVGTMAEPTSAATTKDSAAATAPATADEAINSLFSIMEEMLKVTADIQDADGAKAALPKLREIRDRADATIHVIDDKFSEEQLNAAEAAHRAETDALRKRMDEEDARLKKLGVDIDRLIEEDAGTKP